MNVASSRTPIPDFLSTICCVEENHLSLSSLLVSCNFVDSNGDQIIPQLWSPSFASTSLCSLLCFRFDNSPHGCFVHTANLGYHWDGYVIFTQILDDFSCFLCLNMWIYVDFPLCPIPHGDELMCYHNIYWAANLKIEFKQIFRWFFLVPWLHIP